MSNPFAEFAEAAARSRVSSPLSGTPDYHNVAILGGGEDARLIAALCLSEGASVTLFSAYGAELDAMRATSGIALRGAGPVGSYHIDQAAGPSVQLTAELDRAVAGAEVIFLTGPIHKIRTYAMALADHLSEGQVLKIPLKQERIKKLTIKQVPDKYDPNGTDPIDFPVKDRYRIAVFLPFRGCKACRTSNPKRQKPRHSSCCDARPRWNGGSDVEPGR